MDGQKKKKKNIRRTLVATERLLVDVKPFSIEPASTETDRPSIFFKSSDSVMFP